MVPATQAASRRTTNSKPSLETSVTYVGGGEFHIVMKEWDANERVCNESADVITRLGIEPSDREALWGGAERKGGGNGMITSSLFELV